MIISAIGVPFGHVMDWCYLLFHNYGLAIVLFTLLTKVILFPVSLWVHKNGITMVRIMPELNRIKINCFGDNERIAEEQQALYKREHYHPLASIVPMVIQLVLLAGVIGAVNNLLGGSGSILTVVPAQAGGITLLMPLAAGNASLILALAQSKISPLQREQAIAEQVVTGAISVGISLALGGFVPLGVGIYWISSNLFSILQQLVLNIVVNPRSYIDYQALEASRQDLTTISKLGKSVSKEDRRREKVDYKRFFSVANKHLVFYSEKSGFYKYFQNVIEFLLTHSNIVIHYVTSDPQDTIFQMAQNQPRIKPYYIGEKKLITLMMKMDADIVVMTTPDLDNYYLKRSYVRKDIEYIYMFHGVTSTNMCVRKGAYDHFDTVMCVGQHQIDELRETEEMYHLSAKTLVPCGYGLLDNLVKQYQESASAIVTGQQRNILIAPSWQDGNILDTCIAELIQQLSGTDYQVVVRPHPEYVKRFPVALEKLVSKYDGYAEGHVLIETDFSSNVTIFTADLVITDWSGIAHEFAYTTKKPVLFIDTPMKVLNADYSHYQHAPLDLTLRNQIGCSVSLNEIARVGKLVDNLFSHQSNYESAIRAVMEKYIFHPGKSGEYAGKYIITQLKNRQGGTKTV